SNGPSACGCAACGVREPAEVPFMDLLHGDCQDEGPADEGPAEPHEPDWSTIEVDETAFADAHPPIDKLQGSDVCVLHAAYPQYDLIKPGSVGWRAMVTRVWRGKIEVSFGDWFAPDDTAYIRPIAQEAAPQFTDRARGPPVLDRSTQVRPYKRCSLSRMEVLRMSPEEQARFEERKHKLQDVRLVNLRPDGEVVWKTVNLSAIESVYARSDDELYHLHPELVDHPDGAEPSCWLCPSCYQCICPTGSKGVPSRPKYSIAGGLDYGWLARVPELTPLSDLEQLLLADHRLYHLAVKVSPASRVTHLARF
ncbi:MAG: hypothetical protein ACPIOQ_21710, partial [Promethearchaeia archaeon]